MSKKDITINDLAIMVKHGFDGMDKRFSGMDKKIDDLEVHVNKRFDKLENLILVDHRQRIERLEMQVADIRGLLAIK